MDITKTCAVSGKEFVIDDRDQAYYKRIGVPHPTLCPEARERRRWAWRGKNFHLRPCVQCDKMAMSYFAPESNIKTVCETCFQSEAFEVFSYGRDFDFSRPFFEQFMELYYEVPKNAGNIGPSNENSRFIICSSWNKNCYLCDETDNCRDCAFSYNLQKCEDIIESIYVRDSQIGYRLEKAENCYQIFCAENVFNCSESAFLKNCRACKKCLFCTDLNSQEYHLFNKPVSKAEFEKHWNFIFSGNPEHFATAEKQWQDFLKTQNTSDKVLVNTEGCTGNYLSNCKDCLDCYYSDNCRDCRYSSDIHFSKDAYDISIYEGELMYETLHAGPKGYNIKFSQLLWFCSDCEYSIECWHSKDCFGCTGLKKSQYCIFNKQYSKEAYFILRDKIIDHMKSTGEYGEFFPIKYSPHAYNHTMAERFYPASAEIAQTYGQGWDTDWEQKLRKLDKPTTSDVPQDIAMIDIQKTYTCHETGKTFRFIPTEIAFYKKWGIPLPTNDPLIRLENLWSRMVAKRKQ